MVHVRGISWMTIFAVKVVVLDLVFATIPALPAAGIVSLQFAAQKNVSITNLSFYINLTHLVAVIRQNVKYHIIQ
jgi:uncharacterized membrane protein YozB (DUF420 family)